MFAVSASASVTAGAAFLGGAASLRAKQPAGSRNAGRGGAVRTEAFFNFGNVKQVSFTR